MVGALVRCFENRRDSRRSDSLALRVHSAVRYWLLDRLIELETLVYRAKLALIDGMTADRQFASVVEEAMWRLDSVAELAPNVHARIDLEHAEDILRDLVDDADARRAELAS